MEATKIRLRMQFCLRRISSDPESFQPLSHWHNRTAQWEFKTLCHIWGRRDWRMPSSWLTIFKVSKGRMLYHTHKFFCFSLHLQIKRERGGKGEKKTSSLLFCSLPKKHCVVISWGRKLGPFVWRGKNSQESGKSMDNPDAMQFGKENPMAPFLLLLKGRGELDGQVSPSFIFSICICKTERR